MANDITKEYLRQKFGELKDAIQCLTAASAVEARSICIDQGEGCLRAYAIVSVTSEGTTILRVESIDGVEIEEYTIVDCEEGCVDVYVAP